MPRLLALALAAAAGFAAILKAGAARIDITPQGPIHRDLKPAKIKLTGDRRHGNYETKQPPATSL